MATVWSGRILPMPSPKTLAVSGNSLGCLHQGEILATQGHRPSHTQHPDTNRKPHHGEPSGPQHWSLRMQLGSKWEGTHAHSGIGGQLGDLPQVPSSTLLLRQGLSPVPNVLGGLSCPGECRDCPVSASLELYSAFYKGSRQAPHPLT